MTIPLPFTVNNPRPTVTAAVTSGQGVLQRLAPQWNTRRVIYEAKYGMAPAPFGERPYLPDALAWTRAVIVALSFWTLAVSLWAVAWTWTLTVGLFTWPIRLVSRSRRKRKRAEAMHRETLDALANINKEG